MTIYTGMGDLGKTTFFGCGMVAKHDIRIEVLGAFDELNSIIGVTHSFVSDEKLQQHLLKIQHDLFQIEADVVSSKLNEQSAPRVTEEHVKEIEEMIDGLDKKLGPQTSFIIPGGTRESSFLHLCRTMTRRAERSLVAAQEVMSINPQVLRYINRLSDLLYMLARDANQEVNVKEQQPIYKYFKEKVKKVKELDFNKLNPYKQQENGP